MTEMIQEPNDESEIEADALIELVDAPPRGSHAPPPPPGSRKSSSPESATVAAAASEKPPAASEPTMPSAPATTPSAPPVSMPEGVRPPPSSPPFSSGRLSSLPLAPPRPGTPSSNPIPGDRPSSPPRISSVPRAPVAPAAQAQASSPPPAPVERTPLMEVQEQLEIARRALTVKDAELRTLLAQRDAGILELESVRHQLAQRELAVKELEFAALSRDARIRELEKELDTARLHTGDAGDDLKRIKGIGPAFERELKRLGVRTFAQVAAWTPEEVESIAKKIKAKPERIRRDNWVARAGELAGPGTSKPSS
jgi:predicted flap endonuclease-1-like 5' DNA nuclease